MEAFNSYQAKRDHCRNVINYEMLLSIYFDFTRSYKVWQIGIIKLGFYQYENTPTEIIFNNVKARKSLFEILLKSKKSCFSIRIAKTTQIDLRWLNITFVK